MSSKRVCKPCANYPLAENTLKRRNSIIELIERQGPFSLSRSKLAMEWGVHRNTIDNDIRKILQQWPSEDQKMVFINMNMMMRKTITVIHKQLDDPDPYVRLEAASMMMSLCLATTRLLEAAGVKPMLRAEPEKERSAERIVAATFKKYQEAETTILPQRVST